MSTIPDKTLSRSATRHRSTLVSAVLVVVLAAFGPIAGARAGQWAQATCSDGGEPVPSEGWTHGSVGGYPANTGQSDTCASGGSLGLRDEVGYQLPESGPTWVYNAPAGATIAGGTVSLSFASPGGQAYLATPANATDSENLLLMCTELCTSPKETSVPIYHPGGTQLFAVTECIPPSGKSVCKAGTDAQMNISSATVLLSSSAKPAGTGFTGTLLGNPTSGTAGLSFTARDEHGPGIYSASVDIDGRTVWTATPNLNEGECVAHGTYEGALKFRNRQPCPQETEVHTEIQTTVLSEGQHALEVEVEDAAGNRATVYTGTITVDNQPPTPPVTQFPAVIAPPRGAPNGTPASDQAVLSFGPRQRRSFTSMQSRSATTLAGELRSPSGTPIQGAIVLLSQQVTGAADATVVARSTTNTAGAWTLKAPRGPSRLLRVAYYSHTLDTTPAATLGVYERVPAIVSMRAPRTARVCHAFVFHGRLTGGYVPPGGESVQIEILYASRWRTIEVVPTNSHGQWAYRYEFTLGAGTRYEFRAATLPNAGYPFLPSHGTAVGVAVIR